MYSLDKIIQTMEDRGYPVFRNASKKFNLNIVGIRTKDNTSNKFNDELVVFWPIGAGIFDSLRLDITTDPGLYYREHPINVNGTAILKEGFHRQIWQLGLHQGKKPALVQRGLATVYRDNNKDEVLDMVDGTEQQGYFGINLHRAGKDSSQVDRWSAGCQVVGNEKEFEAFLSLVDLASTNWGNKFSYTLLLEEWLT